MDADQGRHRLTPLNAECLPESVRRWVSRAGAVTAEQAYDLVIAALSREPTGGQPDRPAKEDLRLAQKTLEQLLPEETRRRLEEARRDEKWTTRRPLGVRPPDERGGEVIEEAGSDRPPATGAGVPDDDAEPPRQGGDA